ncbi:MAG: DUF2304 domain-containing protein [Planctomycetes bacterium]|nr:DUF2304 domain-containing protein [Planctomycetota bacterium]
MPRLSRTVWFLRLAIAVAALTWFVVGAGMILFGLARPLLDRVSDALGIKSGTTTVFLIAMLVIFAVQLQLSVSLSRIEERLRDLAESVALDRVNSGTDDPTEDPGGG